ncbi:MAG: lipopolysaccharide biosynthesis protein [Desulfobulbaceae bacterium]|jgi:O-antigen/teichoic acid export membrane protein|nr:lipopolysaccharide biosynthesis protein [Desulfobulbaceae bacterium]
MNTWRETLFTNGVIFGAGLLGGVLVARFFGPDERGLLAAVIYWPHFLAGLTSLGINEGLVVAVAREGFSRQLVATACAISLVLALVVAALCVPAMPMLLGDSRLEYLRFTQMYMFILLPCSFLSNNLLAIDQGRMNFRQFNGQRLLQAAAYPAILSVLWLCDCLTIITGALAVLAGIVLITLQRLWHFRRDMFARPELVATQGILSQSWRLHLVNMARSLGTELDKMMLVFFAGNAQLGYYVVALTAAAAMPSLLSQTFINIMFPAAARAGKDGDFTMVIRPLRRFALAMALASLLMSVALPWLVRLVYGQEFGQAGYYAQILIFAFALNSLRQTLVSLLRSWRAHRAAFYAEAITALTMLVGGYPAIHIYGVGGLCFLVLFSQVIGGFLVFRAFRAHVIHA